MSIESRVVPSSLSQSRTGYGFILDQTLRLAKDRDFVAVCVFSVIGLLVSLGFAILYAIPAADNLVEMPW